MKKIVAITMIMGMISFAGCEAVHNTTEKAGTEVGKGARAIGGFSEGVAEGVKGTETKAENPYGR